MTNNVLIIAAHPDDEVLGCGGTIAKYSDAGSPVHVAFLADGVYSREDVDLDGLSKRREAAKNALNILGAQPPIFGDFPDNNMDSVPLLQIVKFIEELIKVHQPKIVFTHHCGDLNIDHRCVHNATLTACRPQVGNPVKQLLFFEVASSTEWQTPGSGATFLPNWFEDISATNERKTKALEAYSLEMRKWPHPRSLEGVAALNRWRGATIGVHAAEAFVLGRCLQ